MSDRTVILECINKMKRKEETMTNWEINYEKIGKEADKIYKNNQPYSYARAFIEAILKVADIQGYNKQVTVLKSIDWLTQEATVCKYCKDNICELRTIDRECFGTEDLMECCGMLTQQEIKSEESNPCDKCAGMDWGDCAICEFRDNLRKKDESNHIGEVNEMVEPQQSKARFIKTIGGKLLNTSQIVDIVKSEINETQTVVIDVNNDVRFIQKPINEVIQQLGIEVIYE